MSIILKTEDLTKDYQLGELTVPALRGISLELERGDFVAVMGPSGSGKTTFLNVVGTLDKPTSGKVYIDGEDLTGQSERELTRLRRKKIGFIFQFYNLIPVLTALENVELPMIIAGVSQHHAAKRASALLESTGLLNRAKHRPDELSGGEQQRVAIARALANKPSIILADEPTGDLDSATGRQVMKILFEMSRQEKTTVIVATHDPALVEMADRLLQMRDGRLITDGKMIGHKGA
jgi:putative ABC transport system ATP-binding protein